MTRLACTNPWDLDKLLSHTRESKHVKTKYQFLNFKLLNLHLNSRKESLRMATNFEILKTFIPLQKTFDREDFQNYGEDFRIRIQIGFIPIIKKGSKSRRVIEFQNLNFLQNFEEATTSTYPL